MNIPNIMAAARTLGIFADKHAPAILTGIGITLMITTTGLAVCATPKAHEKIKEKRRSKGENLTPVEVVKTVWTDYIPAAASGAAGTACLIGSTRMSGKRYAALAAAYSLSEASRIEFREKATQVLGEKKMQSINDAVAKEQIEKNPVRKNEIILTGNGNTLCYDALSGRYFYSDIEKIKRAENTINYRMRGEMYISLNDFYDEIGLDRNDLGDSLGWTVDKGMIQLWFSSQLTKEGVPVLVINYENPPEYDYYKTY